MEVKKMAVVLLVAGALRMALIVYGEWQDSHMEVPYTDIDYTVFSDAAAFMAKGQSPYMRDTYRYSPLLAVILLPNAWWHRSWGKLLFSSADLLVGYFIYALLKLHGMKEKQCLLSAVAWLFNPFTFTIGTRGNCEAIVCAIILRILVCLTKRSTLEASIWYGLIVHFRIYPIIYALSFLVFLDANYAGTISSRTKAIRPCSPKKYSYKQSNIYSIFMNINMHRLTFGLVSGSIFLITTLICYEFYGMQFLQEALLYHLTRTDPRHNFSIYFYSIYLHVNKDFTIIERLLSFIPQMSVQLVLAVLFGKDLSFCLFVQTVAFVAFNKVITAQYFVWFFCLLPLILPSTAMRLRWKGIFCVGLWAAAQVHWLYWAYLLEFQGMNVFLQLWLASIVFFSVNILVLVIIISNHIPSPSLRILKPLKGE